MNTTAEEVMAAIDNLTDEACRVISSSGDVASVRRRIKTALFGKLAEPKTSAPDFLKPKADPERRYRCVLRDGMGVEISQWMLGPTTERSPPEVLVWPDGHQRVYFILSGKIGVVPGDLSEITAYYNRVGSPVEIGML